MKKFFFEAFIWVRERFRVAPLWLKVLYGLLGLVLLAAFALLLSQTNNLGEWFNKLPDAAKGVVVLGLFAIALGTTGWALLESTREKQLTDENEQLKAKLAAAEAEVKQHDDLMERLVNVESRERLWQKECKVPRPQFIPAGQRRARFVTVLNLKGGVGKTTLTANLAAGLGLATKPLKVLLVDVDFQGTLGTATVDPALRQIQEVNDHFVHRLLKAEQPDDTHLPRLRMGMSGVPSAQVILAADSLDRAEFELQAVYFLDEERDPRFRFVTHFHRDAVVNEYDLVVFDCPPRVTTSVVNALFCSDAILIPTRLDGGSINAVPRTINWVKSFGPLCPAAVVGVVATHVTVRQGKLSKGDQLSYDRLRDEVQSSYGTDVLFKEVVRSTPDALNPKPGVVASTTATGRQVFAKFVAEFRKRMSL